MIANVPIEALAARTILISAILLVIVFGALCALLFVSWKKEVRRGDCALYSNCHMKLGVDIARSMEEFVNSFVALHPDTEQIDFSKAAYCPQTGRIFPLCVDSAEVMTLSWSFLHTYGSFVSWGSLSKEAQGEIKLLHTSLEGFQIEQSSAQCRPEDIEHEYAMLSPGPLYVDVKTKILLGWKVVPGTYFEVLILQRPIFQSIEETL